jgi:lipopolysaccharide biosynthesis glycosyltransferase
VTVGTLHVSCAAEGAYVPHSAALLHSVLDHAGALAVQVHYLHSPRLAPDDRERLRGMVEAGGGAIAFHEIADERVADLPATQQFTSAMWHRVLLPELLPGVERVLYLDVDTLAVDDLGPLWATDLGGALVAAVTNVFQHDHVGRPAALGLAGPEVYFNSGVLLLDLEGMRREGTADALRRLAVERAGELGWPDQDALNLVLGERRLELHPRWNVMNSMYAFAHAAEALGPEAHAEALARPGIRHFEGPWENKPWHARCRQPLRDRWLAHRRATSWPELVLDRDLGPERGGADGARMGRFWDERAREDAFFFVDSRLEYGRPDEERFWREGEADLETLLSMVGATVAPGDRVLDLGCGLGRLTRALAGRARAVVAVDVSAEMLARARALNEGLDGVTWVHGDGETLAGVEDASCDAAVSHVVFQHIPDPAVTLGYVAELGRVLRDGGWAVFQVSTDPAVHRPRGRGRRLLRRGPRGTEDSAWLGSAVDLAELRAAADAGGLELERVEGAGTQYTVVRARRRVRA